MGGSSASTSSQQKTTTNTTNENLQNLQGVDIVKTQGDVSKVVNITDGGIAKEAFGFAGDVALAAMQGVDKVSTDAIKNVAAATRSDAATVMGKMTWVMIAGLLVVGFIAYRGKK